MYWKKWDGSYEKTTYIIKDSDGRIHEAWPNAGTMHSLTFDGVSFSPLDNVLIWAPIEQ